MPSSDQGPGLEESERGDAATSGAPEREARRREIVRLLEEIRSGQPSRAEIVSAIMAAGKGEVPTDRLQRITGRVLSLYR
jgi:hypothetical protein